MKCKKIIGTMLSLATVLSMFVVPAKAAATEFVETFDDLTIGSSYGSVGGSQGVTATIAASPITGAGNAIKLDYDATSSNYTISCGDLSLTRGKKYSVRFKLYPEYWTTRTSSAMAYINQSPNYLAGGLVSSGGQYKPLYYTSGGAAGSTVNLSTWAANNPSEYITIEYIITLGAASGSTYQCIVNGTTYTQTTWSGYADIDKLFFEFSTGDADEVLWIDDVIVEELKLKLNSSTPAAGATSAELVNNITLTFDNALKTDTFNTTAVKLFADNIPVNEYTVSASGNTLTVTPEAGLQYGKKYKVTVDNTVSAQDAAFSTPANGYTLEFTTKDLIPAFAANVLAEQGMYNEGYTINLQTPGITYEIFVDEAPYVTSPELAVVPIGAHTVKLIATETATGKTQEKEYAIEVVAAVAPEVSNVTITGDPITGTFLTGSYVYSDINDVSGSKEGATRIKWTRATSEAGPYTDIPGATSLYNGDPATIKYQLTAEDEDHYIRLEILPVSTEAPNSPQEPYVQGYSAPFKGDFKPTIENDKIIIKVNDGEGDKDFEGIIRDGETLKGSAVHQDANEGQTDGGFIMGWYKAATAEGPFTEQVSNTAELVIDENLHKDCYLQFTIQPKSAQSPALGKVYKSEPIASIFTPELIGVKLIGEAKAGKTLGVSYVFVDKNNDEEKEIKYQWYLGATPVSTNSTYTLPRGSVGNSVYCVVTPVSTQKPYEGVAVATETVTVVKAPTGGGGGGGGGVYLPPSKDTDKEETPTTPTTPVTPDTPVTPPAPSTDFSDMQGHWATKEVEELVEMGIINGISPNEFGPSKVVTRAQCATMIARALGLEAADAINFGDVPADAWYYDAVALIATSGIMQGSANQFRPDAGMTRQELAAILARCIDTEVELTETEFSDNADIADWAKAEIEKAVALGLMKGTDGKFLPNKVATRAETAVCIWRLLEIMKGAAE